MNCKRFAVALELDFICLCVSESAAPYSATCTGVVDDQFRRTSGLTPADCSAEPYDGFPSHGREIHDCKVTPVKSCMNTRAGGKGISCGCPPSGPISPGGPSNALVTLTPSFEAQQFCQEYLMEKGMRSDVQ